MAGIGLAVFMGATESEGTKVIEEIRARKFLVVDEEGKTLAQLAVAPDGNPVIGFYDANRRLRAGLSVTPAGPQNECDTPRQMFMPEPGRRDDWARPHRTARVPVDTSRFQNDTWMKKRIRRTSPSFPWT